MLISGKYLHLAVIDAIDGNECGWIELTALKEGGVAAQWMHRSYTVPAHGHIGLDRLKKLAGHLNILARHELQLLETPLGLTCSFSDKATALRFNTSDRPASGIAPTSCHFYLAKESLPDLAAFMEPLLGQPVTVPNASREDAPAFGL